ncbi:hypothetical protein PFISCL1PPCAC_28812, partial [Pristionchus fissidentatus]
MFSLRAVVLLLLFALFVHCKLEVEGGKRKTTTTPRPKLKRAKDKLASTKRTLLSYIGKKRMVTRNTTGDGSLDRILYGSMLQLHCDNVLAASEVEWSLDGVKIRSSFSNWRMEVTERGVLEIWPIIFNDTGRWECTVKGRYKGALEIQVLSMNEAYRLGVTGYFTTSAFFLPILAVGI